MLKPLFGIPLLDNILGAMTGGHGHSPSYGGGVSSGYGAPDAGHFQTFLYSCIHYLLQDMELHLLDMVPLMQVGHLSNSSSWDSSEIGTVLLQNLDLNVSQNIFYHFQ